MRIVFIGCVEIGLKCLEQVLKDGWDVKAVFTLAKKYAAKTSGFVDFSRVAGSRGIPLFKVKDINDDVNISRIKAIEPDLIIICGWQRLVREEILDIPKLGAIGFHSSLLPDYRGRAPVNWAIINGEKKTGVTMFYCVPEADTGDIIAQKSFPITLDDTCATVYDKSANAACLMLHKYLPGIERGAVKRIKNESSKHRFWPKRSPEDGRVDWNKTALAIHNWIRALTRPYPGAFAYYKNEKYLLWGSRPYRRGRRMPSKAGQILKVNKKGARQALLVAASDRPIWISDIAREDGRPKSDFVAGERFS